jgi:hypothetical protein
MTPGKLNAETAIKSKIGLLLQVFAGGRAGRMCVWPSLIQTAWVRFVEAFTSYFIVFPAVTAAGDNVNDFIFASRMKSLPAAGVMMALVFMPSSESALVSDSESGAGKLCKLVKACADARMASSPKQVSIRNRFGMKVFMGIPSPLSVDLFYASSKLIATQKFTGFQHPRLPRWPFR